MSIDERWMRYLLDSLSSSALDVPIAACAVDASQNLIAYASNQTIVSNDPTAHAEIVLLRLLAEKLNNYRLPEITVYVTLEPCLMCYGALLQARVKRLVYACSDTRFGVCSRHNGLHALGELNHHLSWQGGVLATEASQFLKAYFKNKRN